MTALEAARLIALGQLTSETLVRSCLERVEELEAGVQAWEHLDADEAIAQARLADRSTVRGPLHGVPLAIKDVIDTVDMPTAYGSRIYRGNRPANDATCVALARAAGAIILGKTVTTEFAMGASGKTCNPHNPAHTPGGSSSGSPAAVACGMVPWAFGTQTYGSTIRPASFCGVVGYKPTYGKADVTGIKTLAAGLDTLGLFARSVADIAQLASVATGGRIAADLALQTPRIGFLDTSPWGRPILRRGNSSPKPCDAWARQERESAISLRPLAWLHGARSWMGFSPGKRSRRLRGNASSGATSSSRKPAGCWSNTSSPRRLSRTKPHGNLRRKRERDARACSPIATSCSFPLRSAKRPRALNLRAMRASMVPGRCCNCLA